MPEVLLCCSAHQAHRGTLQAGVLFCRSVLQAPKGAPWVGSYSVVQCLGCLMSQTFYCSAAHAGMRGERGCGDGATPYSDSAVLPCFHGCLAFLHSHFSPLSPPSLPLHLSLSPVNSSSYPRVAPQSLNSRSQLLCLLGYLCPCPEYLWLQQGLSDSHSM